MNSKIETWEWILLYAIMLVTDVAQIAIDFIPGVGEGLNEIIDPIVGIILAIYFWFRGAMNMSGAIAFVIAIITKEGTFGALPTWTAVVIFIHTSIYFQKKAAAHPMLSKIASVANVVSDTESVNMGTIDGKTARLPSKPQPLNQGGKRLPQ